MLFSDKHKSIIYVRSTFFKYNWNSAYYKYDQCEQHYF